MITNEIEDDDMMEIDGLEEFLQESRKHLANCNSESNVLKKKVWFGLKKWVKLIDK